jgi:hypothetical protein
MENIDYSKFMQICFNYHKQYFDPNICDLCGGTGIVAIMCCNGYMCACQGMPIDFNLECSCGLSNNFDLLLDWNYQDEKIKD